MTFFLWLKSFYLNLFEYPRQGDEFFVCVSKFVLIFCLSSLYFLYSVCLYLFANFLFVSILFLIFCLSHIISLFSVSYSFLIICLSSFLFTFSVCLHLYSHFLSVCLYLRWRHKENEEKMETDRK